LASKASRGAPYGISTGRIANAIISVAAVEDDGDSPFVSMVINLVRPAPAIKRKPVPDQRLNHLASGDVTKLSIYRRRLDGHRHAGLDGNLNLVGRFLRDAFSVLQHAFNDHADHFIDVLERFVLGLAPG
jgi:hypothetical protein